MLLTDEQIEAVKITIERYRNKEKYTVIAGVAGSGKAQPISTIIPTPNGNKLLGEIKSGDIVYDRLGKPTKVLDVFPQGLKNNYKVIFEDGRVTYCNDEHLWSYYTSKNNLATKTLREMIDAGLRYNSKKGGYKFRIPICEPIQYEERDFKIDPYIMGVFLGDGCCREKILTLSSENDEIPNIVANLIGKCKPVRLCNKNYNWYFEIDEKNDKFKYLQTKKFFSEYLDELCKYSYEKQIPNEYLYGSIQQRIDLIQGLLDTDGSICKSDSKRYNIRYTTTSLILVKQIQQLFLSLGYKQPTISIDKRSEKYTLGRAYNVIINIPNEDKYKFFRMSRKKNIALEAKKYHKRKNYDRIAIVDVEKMEQPEKMVCLYVDNDEHLYLTNDYIVTHNTTVISYIIQSLLNEFSYIKESNIIYTSFTGKACTVLRQKGNNNVLTLHKLLYEHYPKPDGTFYKKPVEYIPYNIVVVDEVSMVPKFLIEQLFSHENVYVICCGDDAQLPPVNKDENNHLLDNPHIRLTKIMRQDEGSEIIQIATAVREGREVELFKGNEVQIFPHSELTTGMLEWGDIVLCSTNKTRRSLNEQIRNLKGFAGAPADGDKIICKRNYWETFSENEESLVNGTIGYLRDSFDTFMRIPRYLATNKDNINIPYIMGTFETEFGEIYNSLEIDKHMIETGEPCLDWKTSYKLKKQKTRYPEPLEFEFGYAITVWAAQGSQWDKVVFIEEGFPWEKEEHKRLVYTALTRAAKKILWIKK